MQPATNEIDSAEAPAGALARLWALALRHAAPLAALVVRVAAAGLAYVLQVVLARALGAEDYGVFAYAWAWVTIAGFGATFGFSQIAVRYLAQFHETGEDGLAQGFLRASLMIVGLGSCALALIGGAVLALIPDLAPAAYLAPLALMLLTVPLFAMGDMAEGYARSQGWNLLALAPPYLLRQLLLIAGVPAVYLAGMTPTATLAMLIAFAATLIATIVQGVMVLHRLNRQFAADAAPRYDLKGWASAAGPVFLGDVAQVLRQNADVLILAMYVTPGQLALYFAATRVVSLLGLIEFAVGATAGHRFARAAETADAADLRRLARQAASLTFWPTLAAAVAVSVAAPWILALFGTDYVAGAPLVTVIACGYAARAAIGPAEELLIMRGHGRPAMLAQILGLEVTVILSFALIPVHGALGAAIGTVGALIATSLALGISAARLTGVLPLPIPTPGTSRSEVA